MKIDDSLIQDFHPLALRVIDSVDVTKLTPVKFTALLMIAEPILEAGWLSLGSDEDAVIMVLASTCETDVGASLVLPFLFQEVQMKGHDKVWPLLTPRLTADGLTELKKRPPAKLNLENWVEIGKYWRSVFAVVPAESTATLIQQFLSRVSHLRCSTGSLIESGVLLTRRPQGKTSVRILGEIKTLILIRVPCGAAFIRGNDDEP
jgi:hypothetical protein